MSRFYGFLVASAVLIGGVVLLSGVLVGRFAERRALVYAEAHTVRIVRTQARQHLAARDFELVDPAAGRTAFGRFLRELPGIVRLKVYDRTGRVVWSDEPRLIGQAFPENSPLARALAGDVVTVLEATARAEHTYEKAQAYVAEVYVPITLPGGPAVVGVIEAYEDATPLVLDIRRTKRVLWAVTGAIGALLYGALALIVWTASRNERRAFRRLEDQNREVRNAHEWLAAILAAVNDRMIILDRTMRIVWLNPAARQAYGAVEPVGRACYEVLGGEPDACQACPAARTLHSARVERGVRVHRLANGEVRWLDLVTAPLHDAAGQVEQVLEVARDVTERVEMEERLTQSAVSLERSRRELLVRSEELEQANVALRETQAQLVHTERLAAIGDLVVSLHDAILNPLTGILGALQVVKTQPLAAPERFKVFTEVECEIHRIEEVVRNLAVLRRAVGTRYVGSTTMLDLASSTVEGEAPQDPT